MRLFLAFAVLWAWGCDGAIEQIPLPGLMDQCLSRFSRKTTIVETVGESIASFCFDQFMWRASRENGWKAFNISQEAFEWAHGLLKMADHPRTKRQSVSPRLRIRKEYRRLTEHERDNFHRAIQMLKLDTSILPNRYDALSAIHQGIVTTSAHGGPNFLGFHRVYLLMFENALREKIPTVTIPYWDSTLDQAMMDPRQSVIYSEAFMGNGFGIVTSGPFAHWHTLSGPLIRNIGQSGQLFRREAIEIIVRAVRLAQITEPNAPINSSLEFLHNQVHLWTDGQMGSLNTAAHDPVFWIHHAYVDYVWEIFRRNQRAFGVDPTRDYPTFVNNTLHLPGVSMGLGNFRNIEGLSDIFTSTYYTYEPSPTCSQGFPDCGSPYLQCGVRNFRPMCVSLDSFSAAPFFQMGRRFNPPPAGPAMAAQARLMQQQATNSARIQAQMALQQQQQIRQQIQQQQAQQMQAQQIQQQQMQAQQMQQQQMQAQMQQQQQFQQQFQQHNLSPQQQVLASMNRQNAQQKEIENRGLDDAGEAHQVQKRWAGDQPASSPPGNNIEYYIRDPRGNSIQRGVNIGAAVQQLRQITATQQQRQSAATQQQSQATTFQQQGQTMPIQQQNQAMPFPQQGQTMPFQKQSQATPFQQPNQFQQQMQPIQQVHQQPQAMPVQQQTPLPTFQQQPQSATFQAPMNNMQNVSNMAFQQSFATACPSLPVSHGYQNSFTINGRSDINQWVYIPVKIIYQRPPKFTFDSYPVVNGEAEEYDVYSPNAFSNIRQALRSGTPAAYHKCSQEQSESGKVFVTSQGLNYMGKYREYAIVDHRLAVSVSTTYVAIKSPETGPSQVYLYAYDSCGRICQPFCRMQNAPGFQRCSGALSVNSRHPKLYSMNYGNAVLNFWQFDQGGGSPLMMGANVNIKFHCNFQESWPFPGQAGSSLRDEAEVEPPEVEQRPLAAIRAPPSGPSGTMPAVTYTDEQKKGLNEKSCHIGNGCIVSGACQRCQRGRLYACLGACAAYASCRDDTYYTHYCPEGLWFDQDEAQCRPGFCPSNRNQWWLKKKVEGK